LTLTTPKWFVEARVREGRVAAEPHFAEEFMQVSCNPVPFPASRHFVILVADGEPPYTYTPKPPPTNPPGVQVFPGPPVRVTVPPDTPSGTPVYVDVTDSSTQPQTVMVVDNVA
jgi:hypothetical protein